MRHGVCCRIEVIEVRQQNAQRVADFAVGILGLRDEADIFWTGLLDAEMKWAALEAANRYLNPPKKARGPRRGTKSK